MLFKVKMIKICHEIIIEATCSYTHDISEAPDSYQILHLKYNETKLNRYYIKVNNVKM